MNKINEIGEVEGKAVIRRRERTTGDVLATKRGSAFARQFKSGHEKQRASLKIKQRDRNLGAVNKPLIYRKQGIVASTENKYSLLSKLLTEQTTPEHLKQSPSQHGREVFFKGVGGEKGVQGRKLRPWVKTSAFNEPVVELSSAVKLMVSAISPVELVRLKYLVIVLRVDVLVSV